MQDVLTIECFLEHMKVKWVNNQCSAIIFSLKQLVTSFHNWSHLDPDAGRIDRSIDVSSELEPSNRSESTQKCLSL